MAITKLILNGVEYDIGGACEIKSEGPPLYDGRELSEYTWEQLKTKCTNADFDDLRIGDYKTITLSGGEVVKMQIAGIDTYYKTTGQHHIDWISIDCLNVGIVWNTTSNNNGTSSNINPYLASNVYSYLNNTIYPKLPSDLKAVIRNKGIWIERRYSASGKLTDSTGIDFCYIGNLWVPSEYEVFGSTIWGTKGYSGTQHVQYPLFANSDKHRVKGKGDGGSPTSWWLSTVASGNDSSCCYINSIGIINFIGANIAYYIPICFRILEYS